MKRWTLRILLCLILGAITTVAVAWGCATWVPVAMEGHDGEARAMMFWSQSPVRGYFSNADEPGVILWAGRRSGQSVELFSFRVYDATRLKHAGEFQVDLPSDDIAYGAVSAGWPSLALQGGVWRSLNIDSSERADLAGYQKYTWAMRGFAQPADIFGFLLPTSPVLPLRPIWPGFLIDTLFYAAIWGGVFFGFTSAKRFIRAKRGRCPRCGYDLRGQTAEVSGGGGAASGERSAASAIGCPECGWGRAEKRD